ncbi:hypothetical protein MCHI_002206 [Candidatus Magnetoovum chiemensis]|nr:hypothetical protein MCHI_002206 [Candidatus Magnetoovum chiemensis]
MRGSMRIPAVLIAYSGAKMNSEAGTHQIAGKVDVFYTIFVIGKNLRGEKETYIDIRGLLKLVREQLHALKIGNIVFLWESENMEYSAQTGIMVYTQTYRYSDYLVRGIK